MTAIERLTKTVAIVAKYFRGEGCGDVADAYETDFATLLSRIASLEGENADLRAALKPFVEAHEEALDRYSEAGGAYLAEEARSHLTWDHFKAVALLPNVKPDSEN